MASFTAAFKSGWGGALSTILFCLVCNAMAIDRPGDPPKLLSEKYACWNYAKGDPDGNQCFFTGWERKPDDNRKRQPDNLYRYDEQTNEVRMILSNAELSKRVGDPKNICGMATDPKGTRLALSVQKSRTVEEGTKVDLMVMDVQALEVIFHLSDGQYNYKPSFSPDGQFVAFYSSDPMMADYSEKILAHSAGKVLNLETQETKVFSPSFQDKGEWYLHIPVWLDQDRVVFTTLRDRQHLTKEEKETAKTEQVPCVVAVYPRTGDSKYVLFLYYDRSVRPPHIYVDASKKRLILFDQSTIVVSVGYDLEDWKILKQENGKMQVKFFGIRDDGSYYFEVKERKEQVIPAHLFE